MYSFRKDSVKTKVDFRPPAGARPPARAKCQTFGRSRTFDKPVLKAKPQVNCRRFGLIAGYLAKFSLFFVTYLKFSQAGSQCLNLKSDQIGEPKFKLPGYY